MHVGPCGAARKKRGPVNDHSTHIYPSPDAVSLCFDEGDCAHECLGTTHKYRAFSMQ